MKRFLAYGVVCVLLISGIGLVVYPQAKKMIIDYQQREDIENFKEEKNDYHELYEEMELYNQKIYNNHQNDLKDAWSYSHHSFDLNISQLDQDMIGYLKIEALDIELPLYIGANKENMAKGAAVLNQTSMPIGGKNTNCVIAAHRGYRGSAMFRDIEKLKVGDIVQITNLWNTLDYEVIKCIVINPDDIDAIKIFDDLDMITLITCHPYTKNYQRYVVYCQRVDTSDREETQFPEGIDFYSSSKNIDQELFFQNMSIIVLGILFILIIIIFAYRKLRKR